MRILHLTSGGDVGGAKTHVHSLLSGLMKTETVRLISFMEGDFAKEARELGIPTTVIADRSIFSVRRKVLEIVREGKFEVIHCHGARANMVGAMVRKKAGVPVISTVHSDYKLDYMGRPISNLTYGTINRIALRRMNYHVGVSDSMADLLISRGFDPQRIYSVYNGVDFSNLHAPLSREEFLEQYHVSFDENTTVFGIAARINPVKDMTTLVTAFSKALKKNPNIRLLIAGIGEEEEKIKALAQQTCAEGSVIFLGWLSDTDSFYQALDVNTLTSLSETFPYALTEGARWRCATIASAVGGVPHLIDNGINGFLFPAQDAEALAGHMVELSQNREKRESFGALLHQKTREKFSVDATVEQQKRIYRSVLSKFRRPAAKKDGVVISGAYGQGNIGDETLLATIVSQMRQIDPDIPICVLTRKPPEAKKLLRIDAVRSFSLFAVARRVRKAKLFISGGGTLIQDVTSSRSLFYYLTTLRIAKRLKSRVMLYGCGIGPVNLPKNRKQAQKTLDRCADVITLRDPYSKQYLEDLGVSRPQIQLTADPAIVCNAASPERVASYLLSLGIDGQKSYAFFSLRNWEGFDAAIPAIARSIEHTHQKYGLIPLLFAMEPEHDLPAIRKVAAQLRCPCQIASCPADGSLTVGLVAQMKLVVSMRLHSLIFAAGQGINFVGIAYDPKVDAFFDYLGRDSCILLSDVTEEKLEALIDSAVCGSAPSQDHVRHLKDMAERNAEIAAELLK